MSDRIPCVDDLCTGTIGSDGCCRYCGKPGPGGAVGTDEAPADATAADKATDVDAALATAAGEERPAAGDAPGSADVTAIDDDVTPDDEASTSDEAATDDDDAFDSTPTTGGGEFVPFGADRVPCVDELCTGTIGADGTCRYCGKPGPGS